MALNHKALLVGLSISEWNGKRLDKDVTREVDQAHETVKSGNFNKNLIDPAYLAKIVSARGRIRQYHIDNTLSWGNSGDRLLPAKNFINYSNNIRELKQEFDIAVAEFIALWESIKKEAKARLKTLYKESDYPSSDEIANRFGIYISMSPLPDINDFRIEAISEDEIERIKTDMNIQINERHNAAVKEIYDKIETAIKRIINTLSEDKSFKKSMIENIEELIDVIPVLNYTNDAKLDKLAKDMKSLLADPESIRKDKTVKDSVLKRAEELNKLYF